MEGSGGMFSGREVLVRRSGGEVLGRWTEARGPPDEAERDERGRTEARETRGGGGRRTGDGHGWEVKSRGKKKDSSHGLSKKAHS